MQPGGPPNVAVAGAEVSLRYNANVETIVKDIDGNDLVTTTSSHRCVHLQQGSGRPRYRVMVDAPGWYRIFSGVFTTNSLSPTPPLTLRLTTRIQRNVVVTLTSTAGAVNLAGAAVTFHPVPNTQPAGTPANTPLTGYTVIGTSPYTVTAPLVPTGQWTLPVVPTGGPDFGPFTTAAFNVDDPPRPVPALPPDTNPPSTPVTVSQTLQQGAATITVNWAASCAAQPATGTLPIDLTRTDDGTTRR